LAALLFFLAAIMAGSNISVLADCPNPRLSYEETITGPVEDCEDQVDSDVDAECPDLCDICGRSWINGDYSTGNDICDMIDQFHSASGWIQCDCDPLPEGRP
jgi:hypothetical protein